MAVTLASGGWSVPRQPRLAILGYGSGQQFVDGMDPAVMIGAALVAVGAVAAFAIKRIPQPEHLAVASEVGYVTACACASHEVIVGQAGRAIGQFLVQERHDRPRPGILRAPAC